MDRIAGLLYVDARERAPGTTDRVERVVPPMVQPIQAFDLPLDRGAELALVAHEIGQSKRPDRQGRPSVGSAVADRHQLDAAAAEIAHHPAGIRNSRDDAQRREPTLRLARQDLYGDAGAAPNLGGEGGAVLGIAHRRCCERIEAADADGACERHEPLEMREGRLDALGVELTGLAEPTAQSAQDLLVEQRHRRARERVVDDEADGIGADIDDPDRASLARSPRPAARRHRLLRCRDLLARGRGRRGSGWS